MPNDIDKSLLERLQALRGASEPPESTPKISVDTIERAKTPTREDTLAARLKSLRSQDNSPQTKSSASPAQASAPAVRKDISNTKALPERDEDLDDAFQTDDKTLEDLLADVGGEENTFAAGITEPDDAKVKALLEELADSIPQDEDEKNARRRREGVAEDDADDDSDDSDGEKMGKEVDDVMARYRDEIEIERALGLEDDEKKLSKEEEREKDEPPGHQAAPDDQLPSLDDLPSVPATTASPSTPSDLDSLTTRLAALRTPGDNDDEAILPSVPTNKPSKAPSRLTSRTNYTDEDADSWCTVCLEDATVRCLGCDGDVYCSRCWREMHVGERAGFDERGHKAVQFTREGKGERRKVAIGAS